MVNVPEINIDQALENKELTLELISHLDGETRLDMHTDFELLKGYFIPAIDRALEELPATILHGTNCLTVEEFNEFKEIKTALAMLNAKLSTRYYRNAHLVPELE